MVMSSDCFDITEQALNGSRARLQRFPVDLSRRSPVLDLRVHSLPHRFAKMMDARVEPAHDDRVVQIDREAL
jgi:hypothetical protein